MMEYHREQHHIFPTSATYLYKDAYFFKKKVLVWSSVHFLSHQTHKVSTHTEQAPDYILRRLQFLVQPTLPRVPRPAEGGGHSNLHSIHQHGKNYNVSSNSCVGVSIYYVQDKALFTHGTVTLHSNLWKQVLLLPTFTEKETESWVR